MDKEVQSCLVPEVAPDTLPLHLHQVASICVCVYVFLHQSACLPVSLFVYVQYFCGIYFFFW